MSSVAEKLERAKALIDTPEKWCQEALARNSEGESASPGAVGTARHCSTGALMVAVGESDKWFNGPKTKELANVLMPGVERENVTRELCAFNNERTHADVMALFDAGIARAKAAA